MFPQVGKELKGWAKFFVVVQTVPYILIGIAAFAYLTELDLGFLGLIIAAAIIAAGYFFARLGAIKLYAFGELVDRVCSLEEKVCGEKKTKKITIETKQNVNANGVPVTKRSVDGSWKCVFCDCHNEHDSKFCHDCGVEAVFE